jgi:hypothetical protein
VVNSTNDVFSASALELVSQVRCHGIGANAPLESKPDLEHEMLMEQTGVKRAVIADVVGHEKGDFALDTYGDGSSMKQKLKAISKVKYPPPLNAS